MLWVYNEILDIRIITQIEVSLLLMLKIKGAKNWLNFKEIIILILDSLEADPK